VVAPAAALVEVPAVALAVVAPVAVEALAVVPAAVVPVAAVAPSVDRRVLRPVARHLHLDHQENSSGNPTIVRCTDTEVVRCHQTREQELQRQLMWRRTQPRRRRHPPEPSIHR
jgi:hypothetical protein